MVSIGRSVCHHQAELDWAIRTAFFAESRCISMGRSCWNSERWMFQTRQSALSIVGSAERLPGVNANPLYLPHRLRGRHRGTVWRDTLAVRPLTGAERRLVMLLEHKRAVIYGAGGP